jgi:hypothetical protein
MWKDSYARGERGYNSSIAPPSFRMQLNKVFELVEIFGSVIYHRNPVRTVTVMEYPELPVEHMGLNEPAGLNGMQSPEQQQLSAFLAQQEGEKKKRAFYQAFTQSERTVLWEGIDDEGRMMGYTDNYIRLSKPFDAAQVNTLESVVIENNGVKFEF